VLLSDVHYYAQPLRSDTKFHIHAELIAALQLIQNIQNAVFYKPDILLTGYINTYMTHILRIQNLLKVTDGCGIRHENTK